MYSPFGENSILVIDFKCPSIILSKQLPRISQILISPFPNPIPNRFPSGEYETHVTLLGSLLNSVTILNVLVSQILTILSVEPVDMKLPSGEYLTEVTMEGCSNVLIGMGLFLSHILAVKSSEPVTKFCPFGEK